jgi:uncharacterized protein YbjT (DUF2867 family)
MKNNPLILSVGADGRFAGMVVPQLTRRGARVRGLVHRAHNIEKAKSAGAAQVAVGDLRDKDSLSAALKGVDGLFYIAPVFQPDEAEMGKGVVEAAKQAGIQRIVFSLLEDLL